MNPNTNPKTRICGDCWQLTKDTVKCPVNGQLINIIRTASEYAKSQTLTPGTKVGMQCRTCTDMTDAICRQDATSKSCLACNY